MMSNNTQMIVLSIIIVLGFAAVLTKISDLPQGPEGYKKQVEAKMQEFYRDADVTLEQQAKLKELKEEAKEEMKKNYASIREKKVELMDYIMQEDSTKEIALEKQKEILKLKNESAEKFIDKAFKMKDILNEDQRESFKKFHKEKMHHHHYHKHHYKHW